MVDMHNIAITRTSLNQITIWDTLTATVIYSTLVGRNRGSPSSKGWGFKRLDELMLADKATRDEWGITQFTLTVQWYALYINNLEVTYEELLT